MRGETHEERWIIEAKGGRDKWREARRTSGEGRCVPGGRNLPWEKETEQNRGGGAVERTGAVLLLKSDGKEHEARTKTRRRRRTKRRRRRKKTTDILAQRHDWRRQIADIY